MTEENIIIERFHYNSEKVRSENEVIYFDFEEDFVEDNIRCIPMCVRFKLDACGIKLQLKEWSKMSVSERNNLAEIKCATGIEAQEYRNYLKQIIFNCTKNKATELSIEKNPAWRNVYELPALLMERLEEFNWTISLFQWMELSNLQRFVLLKLCKPGHEHKNFSKAAKEFGLV
ncbi:MAG: nitrate reductase associated protein [Bacteroidota bacterium]|nr:nitrate reductase associated protein [Bacteroidota bacterium]